MYDAEALKKDLRCIETYIAEHGQEKGTVSWQMADVSFQRIKCALLSEEETES